MNQRRVLTYFFGPAIVLMQMLSACSDPRPLALLALEDELPETVDFNFHIKPLLSDRCFKCHGPDANQRKSELRLDLEDLALGSSKEDNSEAKRILSPEKLNNSEVFHRIVSDDPEYMMPPPESNLILSDHEKALISRWIEQGAKYKPHWSFVAPEKLELPEPTSTNSQNPIDHFIMDKVAKSGLTSAAEASKEVLLRRVSLDLTGLPPMVEELDAFLADSSPDAYENAVDRMLGSVHYGERMAVEWLDLARYADSHGYQDDGMRNTWPWRDWVIKAYNENLPHDQFIIWQLAGDLLPSSTKEQLLATCFNRNHPQTQEGGVVDEEYRVEYVADRTNTLGKAFLGLTTECARCHDHKYDPISQKDYYSLYAFFNNNNDTGIVPYNGEAAPTIILPGPEAEIRLGQLRNEIEPLQKELLPDGYVNDFKQWLEKLKTNPPSGLKEGYGLLASFDFEKEYEIFASDIYLENGPRPKPKPGVPNQGDNKERTFAYFNQAKNRLDAKIRGDQDSRPIAVEGKKGKAVQFQGDCGIRFNRDLDFDRNQPFSVSLWIKLLKEGEEGPVFNNGNGDFEGYRGWLCILNPDGTLSFQFNHVWPDNSIDIKTEQKLNVGEWTHVALTYNGSSKASGVDLFINGVTPKHKVLTDNLRKSLLHGVKGSNWSDMPFLLGLELRKSIENIQMDELKVYNRQLSLPEVKNLFSEGDEIPEALASMQAADHFLEYYLFNGYNAAFNQRLKKITQLRKEENLLLTDQPEVMVMTDRSELRPTFILDRGAYDAPIEEVSPNTPELFPEMPADYPKNRLGLAQWLVAPENPLTSRVAVNRFWAMCFGRGLVATQEDFGNQGNLPTHPELLDWLAVHFMESDWDVKSLMKLIVMSRVYRQSSQPSELAKEQDPENLLYSHYPAHRLSAEVIRDHALAASGLLVREIGGPSVYPYQPPGIWKALATRNATEYRQQSGDSLYRRSMYTVWKRSSPPPSMLNFDAPDRYYCVVRRQNTATPLQSLVLMNDPQFVEAARQLGQRMIKEGGASTEDRITFAYKSLTGTMPLANDQVKIKEFYEKELASFREDPDRTRQWLSIGEYPVDKSLDQAELAANASVASTIMNLDAFVTKR